jgi:hypothetical protein
MSDSDSDFVAVSDNSSNSSEDPEPEPEAKPITIKKKDTLDSIMRELLLLGDLRTDNILEVQWILKLIHESPMSLQQKQQTGKTMDMLLMLSNLYLQYYGTKLNGEDPHN